ncbi:hypothetical protein KIPB_013938, partial [Kipferlia bialata]
GAAGGSEMSTYSMMSRASASVTASVATTMQQSETGLSSIMGMGMRGRERERQDDTLDQGAGVKQLESGAARPRKTGFYFKATLDPYLSQRGQASLSKAQNDHYILYKQHAIPVKGALLPLMR